MTAPLNAGERDALRRAITRAYGVPPHVVGLTTAAGHQADLLTGLANLEELPEELRLAARTDASAVSETPWNSRVSARWPAVIAAAVTAALGRDLRTATYALAGLVLKEIDRG